MSEARPVSARSMLRTFQQLHREGLDPGFMADLELLRHKDLDLSIKLGALLAFDALIIGVGVLPVSASPGAPLSVDATTDPFIVLASLIGVGLLTAAAFFSVRAVMIGEEFELRDAEEDAVAIARRVFAAYCAAIDAQSRLLARAARLTIAGGAVVALSSLWALADKWWLSAASPS